MPVLREVVIEGQVYDLLFDGAHNGRDEDLFREDLRIVNKLDGQGRPRVFVGDIIERLIATEGPVTAAQLEAVVGAARNTVASALHRLREEGRLGSREVPGTSNGRGRNVKEYWLLPGGTA